MYLLHYKNVILWRKFILYRKIVIASKSTYIIKENFCYQKATRGSGWYLKILGRIDLKLVKIKANSNFMSNSPKSQSNDLYTTMHKKVKGLWIDTGQPRLCQTKKCVYCSEWLAHLKLLWWIHHLTERKVYKCNHRN